MPPDVAGGILVFHRHPADVGGLVDGELDAQLMPGWQARVAAEVGQRLTFLLAHVVAVRDPAIGDVPPPFEAPYPVPAGPPDTVPDVVMVADGVFRLVLGVVRAAGPRADIQQARVEQLLLGRPGGRKGVQGTRRGCGTESGTWQASVQAAVRPGPRRADYSRRMRSPGARRIC